MRFLLANYTTNKIEDGFAKLLARNDVQKIASSTCVLKADECEETLKAAAGIVKRLKDAGKLDSDGELGPTGRLWVRVAVHAADKENRALMGRL